MTDDQFLDELALHEGGASNDKNDAGGLTIYGLSANDLRELLGREPVMADRDRAVTRDIARAFAARKYLAPFSGIEHADLRYLIVDTAFVQGIPFASRSIQQIVGAKVDGDVGPLTCAAINELDGHELMKLYVRRRIQRFIHTAYAEVSAFTVRTTDLAYLEGWIMRALDTGVDPL